MRRLATCLFVVLALLLACGEPTPEEKLHAATKALEAAKAEAAKANDRLEKREAKLAEAQAAREEAASQLRDAESRLAQAKAAVSAVATDDLLFREVQRRLLADDDLQQVAIQAEVHDGVVTLTGHVPDADLRDRALKVAGEVPGVVDVKSRIETPKPPAPGAGG